MALHTPDDRTFEDRTDPLPVEASVHRLIAERKEAIDRRQNNALYAKILRVSNYLRNRT